MSKMGIKGIEILLNYLTKSKIIKSISEVRYFNDDPKFYYYFAKLLLTKEHTDGFIDKALCSSGVSFVSRESALLKCLGEAFERCSQELYREENIKFTKANAWPQEKFPLTLFSPILKKDSILGYIEGFNISRKNRVILPAGLVYLNYEKKESEVNFNYPVVSTGAAGGFRYESAVLRGIYEVVERDAFMCGYLNSISFPMVDLEVLKDKGLSTVLESIKRYNLELFTFEATNDLSIPCFVSILIDRTGLGPAVSVGAKASLNCLEAIKGSIGETFILRNMIRAAMLSDNSKKRKIGSKLLSELNKRGLYWCPVSGIGRLNFLLNQKPQKKKFREFHRTEKETLDYVVKILKNRGFDVYCADISSDLLKKVNYTVCKILIPGLQPLYLCESQKKFVDKKRLKQVADYFGVKDHKMNQIPHPFL